MHADRAVVQPGGLQGRTDLDGFIFEGLGARPGPDRVERLAGVGVLGTERGDRTAGCVIGPSGDSEACSGIDRFIRVHSSFLPTSTEQQNTVNTVRKCHRCPAQ